MEKYNKEHPLRVFEAFAGIGAQSLALERLKHNFPDFDYKVIGISEVEMNAIAAYRAIHGDIPNYGDISAINWGPFLILTCLHIHSHVRAFPRRVSKPVLKRVLERGRRFYGSAGRPSRSNVRSTL